MVRKQPPTWNPHTHASSPTSSGQNPGCLEEAGAAFDLTGVHYLLQFHSDLLEFMIAVNFAPRLLNLLNFDFRVIEYCSIPSITKGE
jgi:hypothetical protein